VDSGAAGPGTSGLGTGGLGASGPGAARLPGCTVVATGPGLVVYRVPT